MKIGEAPLEHTTPFFCKPDFLIMSPNFAEFLLDTTNNGNEILAVLEDIVEVVETGGTDYKDSLITGTYPLHRGFLFVIINVSNSV